MPVLDAHRVPLVAGGYTLVDRLVSYQEKGVMESQRTQQIANGVTYGMPVSFSMYPNAEHWSIDFRPYVQASVDSPYTVKAFFYDPQPELATDGSDDDTVLRYHAQALMLGTLWLALNERGEELGEPGNMAEAQYQRALSDAVYTDQETQAGLGNLLEAWRD